MFDDGNPLFRTVVLGMGRGLKQAAGLFLRNRFFGLKMSHVLE